MGNSNYVPKNVCTFCGNKETLKPFKGSYVCEKCLKELCVV